MFSASFCANVYQVDMSTVAPLSARKQGRPTPIAAGIRSSGTRGSPIYVPSDDAASDTEDAAQIEETPQEHARANVYVEGQVAGQEERGGRSENGEECIEQSDDLDYIDSAEVSPGQLSLPVDALAESTENGKGVNEQLHTSLTPHTCVGHLRIYSAIGISLPV